MIAARAAWQPYGRVIAEIERELRDEPRPAMWTANHDAIHAGLGHHRATARRASAATERVASVEAHIAAIQVDRADVKQRLDVLEAQALRLHNDAYPSTGTSFLDALDRDQIREIDRLVGALEVWTMWSDGGLVAIAGLAESAELLSDIAREAPVLPTNGAEIDRCEWMDALQPLLEVLHQRDIQLAPVAPQLEVAAPDLGLEL